MLSWKCREIIERASEFVIIRYIYIYKKRVSVLMDTTLNIRIIRYKQHIYLHRSNSILEFHYIVWCLYRCLQAIIHIYISSSCQYQLQDAKSEKNFSCFLVIKKIRVTYFSNYYNKWKYLIIPFILEQYKLETYLFI